jgi:hypothetical protein
VVLLIGLAEIVLSSTARVESAGSEDCLQPAKTSVNNKATT